MVNYSEYDSFIVVVCRVSAIMASFAEVKARDARDRKEVTSVGGGTTKTTAGRVPTIRERPAVSHVVGLWEDGFN